MVGREQLAYLSGQLDPGGDEHDEVVTDPLEVGDQVRGERDAGPLLGDDLHEALQELAPGERVKAGHRLVEEEELGPFRDRHGQGELGPLAAGQRPGPLARVEAEPRDPASRPARRPSPG